MINRWTILAVLFLARLTMAFQFQAIAALSPIIADQRGLGLADIGLLIGLYLAPGIVVALPGGAVAQMFGEKRIALSAMILMLIGSCVMIGADSLTQMAIGRVLAGAGGVVVNVVLTKMLVDWFVGKEISTAMAIIVNSWPVGIALALLILPATATNWGLAAAEWVTIAGIAAGLLCMAAIYTPPPGIAAQPASLKPTRLPLLPLGFAGGVWALYNAALAMIFSFGPTMFVERGWSVAASASSVSAFMILFSIALPFGGYLADKTGKRDGIIGLSLLSFAILMPLAIVLPSAATLVIFLGVAVLFSLAAGPIMTLPSQVLTSEARTFGMGVFFTIYYVFMMILPRIGGSLGDTTGSTNAVILLAAILSMSAFMCLWGFRRTAGKAPEA